MILNPLQVFGAWFRYQPSPLPDLIKMCADLIDELDCFYRTEADPSNPFSLWLLQLKTYLTATIAMCVNKVRIVRGREFQARRWKEGLALLNDASNPQALEALRAYGDSVDWRGIDLQHTDDIDASLVYEEAIALALSTPPAVAPVLASVARHLPDGAASFAPTLEGLRGIAIPLLTNRALDEMEHLLTREIAMAFMFFCRSPVQFVAAVTESLPRLHSDATRLLTSEEYDAALELPAPTESFGVSTPMDARFVPRIHMALSLGMHWVTPRESADPADAQDYLVQLVRCFGECQGATFKSLPRVADADPAAAKVSLPEQRELRVPLMRSDGPFAYMKLVQQVCVNLNDTASLCISDLLLVMLHLYWKPNYTVALGLLARIESSCQQALSQCPLEFGPSHQRIRLDCCLSRARSITKQLQQHLRSGLTSPFFIGQRIVLSLSAFPA
jgi:hypothetical protein